MTFRRTLDTGVTVEVEDNGTMLRLIDHDRTAEWIISSAEAAALRDGLTLLLIDGSTPS